MSLPFVFVAMVGGELGADKSFLYLISIVLSFSDKDNIRSQGCLNKQASQEKIRPLMSSSLSRKIRESGFSFESYDLFCQSSWKKHDKMLHFFYIFCVPLQCKRKFMGLFCDSFCDEVCGVWGLQFLWPV